MLGWHPPTCWRWGSFWGCKTLQALGTENRRTPPSGLPQRSYPPPPPRLGPEVTDRFKEEPLAGGTASSKRRGRTRTPGGIPLGIREGLMSGGGGMWAGTLARPGRWEPPQTKKKNPGKHNCAVQLRSNATPGFLCVDPKVATSV